MTRAAAVATPQQVLDFWFGAPPAEQPRREWFAKDCGFDAEVRRRFDATIDAALQGRWPDDDDGTAAQLAKIVVLDQFTRNAHRDTPRAFAGDAAALAAARRLVASGADRALPPLQRWFAYLPYEHAEDLATQDEAVALFESLAAEHPVQASEALDWAVKHRDVVARFGRFPHRNLVLGRVSTDAESDFLAQPGSSF